MSDDEGGWHEDAENEGGDAEGTAQREEEKSKSKKHAEEGKGEEKTEAQIMIEAKQRKHEEEEGLRLRDLEEQRRLEREKEEEELRRLKEKQAQRKKEREEEEKKLEEQRLQQEEQRKKEEEQRRQEKEAEKQRKQEEAERKKAAATAAMVGGRNFTVSSKQEGGESTMDKFMNISKAKTEMGLNTGELEALKRRTIEDRVRPLSVSDMDFKSLQKKAEELWKQIVSLESAKYDLSERSKRQEYDLKELNERQRQTNQKKYLAQGMDVEQNTRHPPKVQIISKYERRTDRRTFSDRKVLYDGAKGEEQKELNKPKGVRRENWIKAKEVEAKRGSRQEVDEEEEEAPRYQQQQQSNHEQHEEEEVAAGEEEE